MTIDGVYERVFEPGERPPVKEPTYAAPLGTIEEARSALKGAVRSIIDQTLAYKPLPLMPKPETEAEKQDAAKGIFRLRKQRGALAPETWVYWDGDARRVTATAADNRVIGRVIAAAGDRDRSVRVRIKQWHELGPDGRIDLSDDRPPSFLIIAPPGVGKTTELKDAIAPELLAAGWKLALSVPTHRLGDQTNSLFQENGIDAGSYRGRDQDDPLYGEKVKMCLEDDRVFLVGTTIHEPDEYTCKNKDGKKCDHYDECGFQRQKRETHTIWTFAHQLDFQRPPDCIPKPDFLINDENPYHAAIQSSGNFTGRLSQNGSTSKYRYSVELSLLNEWRDVPVKEGSFDKSDEDTKFLRAVSCTVHDAIQREPAGRLRRALLNETGLTISDLSYAGRLEWRRRKPLIGAFPGMPKDDLEAICGRIAVHNQKVRALTRFWELMVATLSNKAERSIYLEYNLQVPVPYSDDDVAPGLLMQWVEKINPSWPRICLTLDATMSVEIARQFHPRLLVYRISAAMPEWVYVRQITDASMSKQMLAKKKTLEEVMRYIEVRIAAISGRIVVISYKEVEEKLRKDGRFGDRVEFAHFGAVAGLNDWGDVSLLIVIGRPLPELRDVENRARLYFDADINSIDDGKRGHASYLKVSRYLRMRDGAGVEVRDNPAHPDWRVEEVRRHDCEGGVLQVIGRGRGINRTAANPLQIDILTSLCLPNIEVNEAWSWKALQPTFDEVMWAREGAVPQSDRDKAEAYRDLFPDGWNAATRKALQRDQNRGQIASCKTLPIRSDLSPVFPDGFSIRSWAIPLSDLSPVFAVVRYRRVGSRGPAGALLYNPARIDPIAWLNDRLGPVEIVEGE